MSMLAERKRKTKWVLNPTKKPLWITDSSGIKFGKELMEKMGWSAGKGLGVNEQGIQEPLKVSYKNDTKGMGFRGNDDNNWIEQQDEFNELLNQLRNNNTSTINISEEEKVIKSLEEKSKQSKARMHYQKFTRGKDLSRYSDHDLACILGTNKTKKEKSKTENNIQIESRVTGNCETSFGVTTINSGSVQDYFKKKWIIDKKSNNSSNMTEDSTEIFNESYQKTGSCFVKSEQNLISESEEEKFNKREHKSSFEEHFNINGNKTSNSETLESLENNVKNKKKKREFQEINLEIKIKKKKSCDHNNVLANENLQKNENHLMDNLNYGESKSLVYETGSYNSVKKIKKEKTHLKLDVIKDEKNYSCVAENKKKINHEKGCIPDVSFAKKLSKTNVEKFILEEEISESRKTKKSKKEKLKERNELKYKDCCYISTVPLYNQDGEITEIDFKIDSVKKKKKNEEKDKYLKNKDIESKDYSNEKESFYDHGEEKMNGIIGRDDALDIDTIKKRKKKKYKKRKLENVNCKIKSIEESNLEEEFREKDINTNEQENALKIQSFGKKKRKKDKHEKEKADMEFNYHHKEKSVLEEISKETNINKVIFSTVELENVVKGELYQKKEKKDKKKKKKEKSKTDNINCFSNPCLKMQVQENTLELELLKKKKKKKDKREKLDEKEQAKMEINYDHKEKSVLEETFKKTSIYYANTDSTETESIEKKKDKKDEKEQSVGNKKEFLEYLTIENKAKMQKQEKIEKPNSEVVDKKIDLSNNKTSAFHFMINDKMEEGTGVHRHKTELLNEKRADKFYPGQHTKDRVLRLICWSNIAGFKGSNLDSVTGYGFLTKCEKNKSK